MSQYSEDLWDVMKQRIESYAFPTLAEINKVDTQKYICECVALKKDGEKTDQIYPEVPLPKFWGTSKGGVFMAPSEGTKVLISFLDHDYNYPIVTAIMGSDHEEEAKEDTMIIKCGETEMILGEKLTIKANGVDLGTLLGEMADNIADLSTQISIPLIGACGTGPVQVTSGTIDISPSQKASWKKLKSEKISKLFE